MKEVLPKNIIDFLNNSSQIIANSEYESFNISNWCYFYESIKEIKSPIEQLFYISFKTVQKINNIEQSNPFEKYDLTYLQIKRLKIEPENFETCLLGLGIFPQYKLGDYIVDFLITFQKNIETKENKIIIELDGHEFHDKNKQQRIYEKKRDRFLQKQGYKVFHYTGTEIFKNPYYIASEVIAEVTGRDINDLFGMVENYNNGQE